VKPLEARACWAPGQLYGVPNIQLTTISAGVELSQAAGYNPSKMTCKWLATLFVPPRPPSDIHTLLSHCLGQYAPEP